VGTIPSRVGGSNEKRPDLRGSRADFQLCRSRDARRVDAERVVAPGSTRRHPTDAALRFGDQIGSPSMISANRSGTLRRSAVSTCPGVGAKGHVTRGKGDQLSSSPRSSIVALRSKKAIWRSPLAPGVSRSSANLAGPPHDRNVGLPGNRHRRDVLVGELCPKGLFHLSMTVASP